MIFTQKTGVIGSAGQISSEIDSVGTGAKTDKLNVAVAIAVVVAISLVAVALYFAEVKWGFLSTCLTWTLASPLIGASLTILTIGCVSYAVYRHLDKTSIKPSENENRQQGSDPAPEINQNIDGVPQQVLSLLREHQGNLAAAHANYREVSNRLRDAQNLGTDYLIPNLRVETAGSKEKLRTEIGNINVSRNIAHLCTHSEVVAAYDTLLRRYPYQE